MMSTKRKRVEGKVVKEEDKQSEGRKDDTKIHPLKHKNLLVSILSYLTTRELVGIGSISKFFQTTSWDARLWRRVDLGARSINKQMKSNDLTRLLDRASAHIEWLSVELDNDETLDLINPIMLPPKLAFLQIHQEGMGLKMQWHSWLMRLFEHRHSIERSAVVPLQLEIPEDVFLYTFLDHPHHLNDIEDEQVGTAVTMNGFCFGQCAYPDHEEDEVGTAIVRECFRCHREFCRNGMHWGVHCHSCFQSLCIYCWENEDDGDRSADLKSCNRPECQVSCTLCGDVQCKACANKPGGGFRGSVCARAKVPCHTCGTMVCKWGPAFHYCPSSILLDGPDPMHVICMSCVRLCSICKDALPCRACCSQNKPIWDKLHCDCDVTPCHDDVRCSLNHILKCHMTSFPEHEDQVVRLRDQNVNE